MTLKQLFKVAGKRYPEVKDDCAVNNLGEFVRKELSVRHDQREADAVQLHHAANGIRIQARHLNNIADDLEAVCQLLKPGDFRVKMWPVKRRAARRITVQRLTDNITRYKLVHGTWEDAERVANEMAHEMGLDPKEKV
jgi:hypothetical protein